MSVPVSNNEIKFVKSLEQKKFRDAEGMFVVEGEFTRLPRSGFTPCPG